MGENCRFWHLAINQLQGTVFKWKSHAPRGAFGFVDLQSGERVFMPASCYVGRVDEIREGMAVIASEIGGARGNGRKRVAGRVEPV